MPENNIKLTASTSAVLIPFLLSATGAVLLFIYATLTPLIWILLIILSLVAVYNLVSLFREETVLQIDNECMTYKGKMMKWDTIKQFETITYSDRETGDRTDLVLKLTDSYLDVNINISRLGTKEYQIREWIKKYSTLPVDMGHRTIST